MGRFTSTHECAHAYPRKQARNALETLPKPLRISDADAVAITTKLRGLAAPLTKLIGKYLGESNSKLRSLFAALADELKKGGASNLQGIIFVEHSVMVHPLVELVMRHKEAADSMLPQDLGVYPVRQGVGDTSEDTPDASLRIFQERFVTGTGTVCFWARVCLRNK